MKKLKSFVLSGALILLCSNINLVNAGSYGIQGAVGGKAVARPAWHNNPANLGQALGQSDAVVLARVTGINSGPDIVHANPSGKDHHLPTQWVSFKVKKVLKGKTGKKFKLFRTGGPDLEVHEDPDYSAGQTYLLFLVKRDDGTYRLLSPEGRFGVSASGSLESADEDGYAAGLNGTSLEGLLASISNKLSNQSK